MMVLLKDMILVNTGIMHWAHPMKKLTQFQSLLRLISFSNEAKCRSNVLLMMTLKITLRPKNIYLTTKSMIHFVHMSFLITTQNSICFVSDEAPLPSLYTNLRKARQARLGLKTSESSTIETSKKLGIPMLLVSQRRYSVFLTLFLFGLMTLLM